MAQVASVIGQDMVEVRDLCVRYGETVALDAVSLSVERGRVLAIVGANGAGKSTLFRALLGLIPIERGELRLLGRPARRLGPEDRARIAYVSERHAELGHARVGDLARLRRSLYPRFDQPRFRALLGELAVSESARVGELSRGQRALVAVGLALAQGPEILLLDDPTLGLDPLARRRVIQSLIATREREVTILFASHELADVERIADDVLLLARGRGSIAIETESFVADACVCVVGPEVDRAAILALDGVLYAWPRRHGHEVVLRGEQRDRALRELADLAHGRDVAPRPVSFEELALAWLAADRGVA